MSNTTLDFEIQDLPQGGDRLATLYEEARTRLRLAEGLLACLKDTRTECEAHLTRLQKDDVVKSVTGRSSLDEKIVSTTRMVDSLRRVVEELARKLQKSGALSPA